MQTTVTVPGVDLKLLRRQMDALVRMEQSTTNQKEVDALEGIINFLEGALDAGDGVPAPTHKGPAKGDKCKHKLLEEAIIMHSRIQAILKCEEAIEALAADDCFGYTYPDLLRADLKSLTKSIRAAGGSPE